MKKRYARYAILFWVFLLVLSTVTMAQSTRRQPNAADQAAGLACCGTFVVIPIVFFVLNIALLVWVARDAKSRGMDSSVIWMLLVFFTSFIGLIIYLFSRPQGNLVQCQSCNNSRMQASAKCPHCGNA